LNEGRNAKSPGHRCTRAWSGLLAALGGDGSSARPGQGGIEGQETGDDTEAACAGGRGIGGHAAPGLGWVGGVTGGAGGKALRIGLRG
jgi:hypothetical protein